MWNNIVYNTEVYKAVILEFYIMYSVCNNNMLYNNLCNQV